MSTPVEAVLRPVVPPPPTARKDLTAFLWKLAREYFPLKIAATESAASWTDGPLWYVPGGADDDTLVKKALRSKSADQDGITFADLWTANADRLGNRWPPNPGSKSGLPYDASSADQSLINRLVWWAGGDCARVERLMQREDCGLRRKKWDGRADYRRDTILNALALIALNPPKDKTMTVPQFGGTLPPGASITPIGVPGNNSAATPAERYPIFTFEEMINRPRLNWIIKGILPAEGIAALYGAPGSGKSFTLFDMLASIARGIPWFGRRVRQSHVLYVALEGEGGFRQRAAAYASKFGTKPNMLFITAPLNLRDASDLSALIAAVRAKGWAGGVIAVDTLNAAMPGADENSSQDMGGAISALRALQVAFGGLVILVHHTGKDAAKGLRGHSSLIAALDAAIEVARPNAGPNRTWSTAKVKDGADEHSSSFVLESVYLGKDEDGDAISSCVVKPSEAVPIKPADDLKGLGGNQRLALETLKGMFADPAARAAPPDEVPAGKPYVSWEAAKEKVGSNFDMEKRRQRTEAGKVLQKLVDAGRLGTGGEYLWPVADVGPVP